MYNIVDDKREIQHILISEGQGGSWCQVKDKITRIEPYYEGGEMGNIIWFRIWEGDKVMRRVNGKYVSEIAYKDKP